MGGEKGREVGGLNKEIGDTRSYVNHEQVEAMTLADKIVVLRLGSIEQVGAAMELYREPENKFVGGFIGTRSGWRSWCRTAPIGSVAVSP